MEAPGVCWRMCRSGGVINVLGRKWGLDKRLVLNELWMGLIWYVGKNIKTFVSCRGAPRIVSLAAYLPQIARNFTEFFKPSA